MYFCPIESRILSGRCFQFSVIVISELLPMANILAMPRGTFTGFIIDYSLLRINPIAEAVDLAILTTFLAESLTVVFTLSNNADKAA